MSALRHIVFDDNGISYKSNYKEPINYKSIKNEILLPSTNFIYKLKPLQTENKKFDIETYRKSKYTRKSKVQIRIEEIESLGYKLEFQSIQSKNLQLNIELIDSKLPDILSYLVYYKYKTGKSKLIELIEYINSENPLKYNILKGHPFYEYKLKNFLTDNALGMTPESVWKGTYDATGGIIIVKEDGDIVCYHIYNKNEFQDYLINNTKIEQAAICEDGNNPGNPIDGNTKPYKFGRICEENKELYIKLNLQIRFNN